MKTEIQLAWDEVRREIEARIRTKSAHAVARAKNTVLPSAQEEFEAAVAEKGLVLALESGAVNALVEEVWNEAFDLSAQA